MTGQLTPNGIAVQLGQLARDLDDVTKALNSADRESVARREDYTLAYARAFLTAEGAMEARKQIAIEQTTVERLAAETADQVVRGLRRQVDTLRIRIDVGRSVGTAMRAELTLNGAGVSP